MRSFEKGFLKRQQIPHSLVRTVRLLGEYRGKEALFIQQTHQVLESLRQVAIIQSTESSNRIEGIEAPAERIKKLVEHKITPKTRSEQEIAGYRDALATIHANHANMPFTTGMVLQLHRDLYQFVPQQGGRWKMTDNVPLRRLGKGMSERQSTDDQEDLGPATGRRRRGMRQIRQRRRLGQKRVMNHLTVSKTAIISAMETKWDHDSVNGIINGYYWPAEGQGCQRVAKYRFLVFGFWFLVSG